ncbi:MAG: hypothetical protein MPJ08_05410 [Nitrosopumilus sp.]|nr:hypothetical protein [Nitrosopumilus sp.]
MSFQEPLDPFVKTLQDLINTIDDRANAKKFESAVEKIHEKFPFVDLRELLEMYVNGEYSKSIIEKFQLSGYKGLEKILQILRLPKKRRSKKAGPPSRRANLSDKNLADRYEFLSDALTKADTNIREKIFHNAVRAILVLRLYQMEDTFVHKKDLVESVGSTAKIFRHLLPNKEVLSRIPRERLSGLSYQVLAELESMHLLEGDGKGRVRLEQHQMRIESHMLSIIKKSEGIIHERLADLIKERLKALSYAPHALFLIKLGDLVKNGKVVHKKGYWKLRPYYDEYFTSGKYSVLGRGFITTSRKNKGFFGRRILPDEFIEEIIGLQRGDFEDEDDQVTRIAGMIMANSNMMAPPPNELSEFDFVVDLSSYEFTPEQQRVIQDLNLEVTSKMSYVKVMINEKVTIKVLSKLAEKLKERGFGEQGYVVSFMKLDEKAKYMIGRSKIIQVIDRHGLKEWCKITPVIPSRRGAVAVVRHGGYKGSIVKINSVNYESGMANIVIFPDMMEVSHYIGSLEEITLPVNTKKFVEYSSKYFEFLGKLRLISTVNNFRMAIGGDHVNATSQKSIIVSSKKIECNVDKNHKTKIDMERPINSKSLLYATDDLFECTCYQWRSSSKETGLCKHLIITLNRALITTLSSEHLSSINIRERILSNIEYRMDIFLKRIRYCTHNKLNPAKCPNCGAIADTLDEVDELFGFRKMNRDDPFSLRRQSQCKACRSSSSLRPHVASSP